MSNPILTCNFHWQATFRRWPTTSLHPFGTLDGEIGLIGELTSEEKAILADNHVISEGFSEQCLKSLPAIPWPIPPAETKVRRDVNGPETRVFTLNRDFKHGECVCHGIQWLIRFFFF